MKKASPPNGVYVVTFIALMLGINSVLGGGAWITNSVRQSSSAFALVGVVSLLVGILDIAVGAGFFWARSWSWALGILAALVTGILGALEMNVQSQSLSVGTGFERSKHCLDNISISNRLLLNYEQCQDLPFQEAYRLLGYC